MDKFLVFAGDCYYPNGGWADYHGEHASLEEAQGAAEAYVNAGGWAGERWAHVMANGAIVSEHLTPAKLMPDPPDDPDRLVGNEESLTITGERATLR